MLTRLACAGLLLASVGAFAQSGAGDERAIRDLDKQWTAALAAKDLDKTVSFYADDAVALPFNAPLMNGKEQIRGMWQHLYSDASIQSLSFAPTKIVVARSGDMAYDYGTVEERTSTDTIAGKYVVVWRKDRGKWTAVVDSFSTDK